MRVLIKIVFTVIAFFLFGAVMTILKGGDASQPGSGGPIGLIVGFGLFAGVVAIWRYNPEKSNNDNNSVENQNLKKD